MPSSETWKHFNLGTLHSVWRRPSNPLWPRWGPLNSRLTGTPARLTQRRRRWVERNLDTQAHKALRGEQVVTTAHDHSHGFYGHPGLPPSLYSAPPPPPTLPLPPSPPPLPLPKLGRMTYEAKLGRWSWTRKMKWSPVAKSTKELWQSTCIHTKDALFSCLVVPLYIQKGRA